MPERNSAARSLAWSIAAGAALLAAGCATAPLESRGGLASYDGMLDVKGPRTKARIRIDQEALALARTARIAPVTFAASTDEAKLTEAQKALLAANLGRSLCEFVSRRLDVVAPEEAADLTLTATVTYIQRTGGGLAAASALASRLSPVPFTPRLPVGLGALAGEAEAIDASGKQVAAMVWARGADAFTTNARVSSIGDAYQLSEGFGRDFGRMITRRADPFKRAPKKTEPDRKGDDPQCAVYGKDPGVADFIASRLALPPEWTDKGAAKPAPEPKPAPPTEP